MKFTSYIIPIAVLFIVNDSNFIYIDNTIEMYYHPAVSEDCYHKGHRLYGRIQIVDSFPDLRIEVVTSFPELKVKIVDSQPTKCGEWEIVNAFPDLKVQFVNSFPDIKIEYVHSFPGLTNKNKIE